MEFDATARRRDLLPRDTIFDEETARTQFLEYWKSSCVRRYARLPAGSGSVTADVIIDETGSINDVRVNSRSIWFTCTTHRCGCADLTNAAGSPQTFTVSLPRG